VFKQYHLLQQSKLTVTHFPSNNCGVFLSYTYIFVVVVDVYLTFIKFVLVLVFVGQHVTIPFCFCSAASCLSQGTMGIYCLSVHSF